MVVLGLDAAWTTKNPSGVAIIVGEPGQWRCAAVTLIRLSERRELVADMEAAAGAPITLASVDMPLATTPITSRRAADTLISRTFGARGCSVHSPSAERPGAVSTDLMASLSRSGFELAADSSVARERQVIEVYPHIAVMRLLNENYRVPYKVARAGRHLARENMGRILDALQQRISGIPLELPPVGTGPTALKRFEDALDGIVCAWIGTRYLEGQCESYGDDTAAIWVPREI